MEPNRKDAGYAGGGPRTSGYVKRCHKRTEYALLAAPSPRRGAGQTWRLPQSSSHSTDIDELAQIRTRCEVDSNDRGNELVAHHYRGSHIAVTGLLKLHLLVLDLDGVAADQ